MKLYAEISKMEAQEDGTLKVWGYASSEAVDCDGETISSGAMKAALPDYMKFGAVREMHQPMAAGTAIEASVEADGKTFFGAHVIDPIAVKKVQAGVYKGFSIGGSVLKRDPENRKSITSLRLTEISLVDRPANPEAVFTCYKAAADKMTNEEAIAEVGRLLDDGQITTQELVKAARAAIEPTPVEEQRSKVVPANFRKGMATLARFTEVLQAVAWMQQDVDAEAQWEGDNSPLPQQLRDWLATGIMVFETMATEEADELLASLMPPDAEQPIAAAADAEPVLDAEPLSDVALAEPAGDVAKSAGAEAVPSDATLHTEAALGPLSAPAEPSLATKAETAAVEAQSDLVKVQLANADEKIALLLSKVESLASEMAALKAKPAPGKAFLKAISKGEDVSSTELPATTPEPVADDPLALVKAAHSRGMTLTF